MGDMDTSWLVQLINHPAMPWGGGGLVGGIAGFFVGQPDCSRFPCVPATLPIVGPVATETAIAMLTVVGAVAGGLYGWYNRSGD